MARNSPVTICITRQSPSSDPKFHQPLIVDGVGRSTKALFAVLNNGCLFLVGLFIILCVVDAPWIRSHIQPFYRHARLKRYDCAYCGKMFFVPYVRAQCFATRVQREIIELVHKLFEVRRKIP